MRIHRLLAAGLLAWVLGCAPSPQPQTPAVDTAAAAATDAHPADAQANPDSSAVEASGQWLATELLGRPRDDGATVNIVPAVATEAYVEFGTAPGSYDRATAHQSGPAGEPLVFELGGLPPDARAYYRVRFRQDPASGFSARPEFRFHTQRAPASSFVFTIQADSHLDDKSSAELYEQTLALAGQALPDFHIDLGDTFMCEKHSQPFVAEVKPAADMDTVLARYLGERHYFGQLAHSVPLLLVNGNHEGELGYLRDGTPNNLAIWTTLARKRYYPNPEPNAVYTTPQVPEPIVGSRQHPYAFRWGSALFVVLDPFWFTVSQPKQGNRWTWTLGKPQYDWLAATLKGSDAPFKFVFAHHIVGGNDPQSRGGVEMAPYFEWGGKEPDGTDTFAKNRPGWGVPIHPLFVQTHVSAFFHGHDHVYVRQELDGVVYQEVPQPSAVNWNNGPQLAKDGGYLSGTILGSSGHLRVTVSPKAATVEYVRSWLPKDQSAQHVPGSVADTYTMLPK